jgi:hypothetical protein
LALIGVFSAKQQWRVDAVKDALPLEAAAFNYRFQQG